MNPGGKLLAGAVSILRLLRASGGTRSATTVHRFVTQLRWTRELDAVLREGLAISRLVEGDVQLTSKGEVFLNELDCFGDVLAAQVKGRMIEDPATRECTLRELVLYSEREGVVL